MEERHTDLVSEYYIRDNEMELNNNSTIIKAMVKLRYYNINLDKEINNYYIDKVLEKIKNELTTNFNSNVRNKTLNELINFDVDPAIIVRYNRSMELFNFLDKTDTYDFYNSLTINELEYLGY